MWGAIVGGLSVNAIKSWLTGNFPEIWLYALGVLFIATTLFLPKGIAGALDRPVVAAARRQARGTRPWRLSEGVKG